MIQLIPMLAGAAGVFARHMVYRDVSARLPKGQGVYQTRRKSEIRTLVLHHSASAGGDPWTFATWHIDKGWPGIGYHYLIMPSGLVYKTNKHKTISYHVANGNTDKLGICFVGDFSYQKPTLSQVLAGKALINYLRITIPTINHIGAHRDYVSTTCPGEHFPVKLFT